MSQKERRGLLKVIGGLVDPRGRQVTANKNLDSLRKTLANVAPRLKVISRCADTDDFDGLAQAAGEAMALLFVTATLGGVGAKAMDEFHGQIQRMAGARPEALQGVSGESDHGCFTTSAVTSASCPGDGWHRCTECAAFTGSGDGN
jgi:hypothetical protein